MAAAALGPASLSALHHRRRRSTIPLSCLPPNRWWCPVAAVLLDNNILGPTSDGLTMRLNQNMGSRESAMMVPFSLFNGSRESTKKWNKKGAPFAFFRHAKEQTSEENWRQGICKTCTIGGDQGGFDGAKKCTQRIEKPPKLSI